MYIQLSIRDDQDREVLETIGAIRKHLAGSGIETTHPNAISDLPYRVFCKRFGRAVEALSGIKFNYRWEPYEEKADALIVECSGPFVGEPCAVFLAAVRRPERPVLCLFREEKESVRGRPASSFAIEEIQRRSTAVRIEFYSGNDHAIEIVSRFLQGEAKPPEHK